ncbi:MAG: penicillin-binding transpeptidase domain-containing protein [Polyangiales bacterium]|nr:hypothetical protein [Myxococcales bacterium]MCB9659898.1 hypothetical protein [Sandaracinaceae bacterium]
MAARIGVPSPPPPPLPAANPNADRMRALVDAEVQEIVRLQAPLAVVIAVVDVPTGALLALGDYGGASLRRYPPSGTLRPLVLAGVIEAGADPLAVYPGGDGEVIMGDTVYRDSARFGDVTMAVMTQGSSTLAPALLAVRYLDGGRLGEWLVRLGVLDPSAFRAPWPSERTFDEATGVPQRMDPVAMARAYAILANDGRLADGRQLMRVETAHAVRSMLEAVTSEAGTGRAARVAGMRVGGKTGGTWLSEWPINGRARGGVQPPFYCSFVGMLPMEAPRLVVLVGMETDAPRWDRGHAATPHFARLAPQLLALAPLASPAIPQ